MKYSLTIRKEAEFGINSAFEFYEIQRFVNSESKKSEQ